MLCAVNVFVIYKVLILPFSYHNAFEKNGVFVLLEF